MTRNSHLLFFCLILFLGGSVLFRNLDSLSVRMWDESRNALNALEMIKSGNPLVVKYEGAPDLWNTKPPLLIWCIALSMKFVGVNELAVRLPSVIATLIIIIGVFIFLYQVSGKNIIAGCGAMAVATFPGFIDYHIARNGDFDAMLAMWIFLSGWCYYLWLHDSTGNNRYLYLAALSIACAVLTKSIAGLLMLPGFIIYAILVSELKKIFASLAVYKAAILAIIPVAGYYLARELAEPGYLATMLENEITGRYLNVNEEHAADKFFYFRSLLEYRLGFWKYVIPVSMLAWIAFGRKHPLGKVTLFGVVCSLSYLVVISVSKTKLPWYDAASFPFIAVACAGGMIILVDKILNTLQNIPKRKYELLRMVFVIALITYPFIRVHSKTSVKATQEQTYPELYYGDMIRAFFESNPQDSLTVIYDGYNSHALFYVRSHEALAYNIKVKNTSDTFVTGENVLTCEEQFYEAFKRRYKLITLFENRGRYLSQVREKQENPVLKELAGAVSKLKEQIETILGDENWRGSIEKKAIDGKIPFLTQLKLDALYMLEMDQKITKEEAELLKLNYDVSL